ncbi:histone H1-like [Carica papaya]|uniref:histone H1-like n=1 Tax=Carica papaya TaxID=3649 RepID=UPI000B8CB270|nr:histone H1-like [Carica papaya]
MARETALLRKKEAKTSSDSSPSRLHPPYFDMISDAISTLKDRRGSSQQAIAKFMEEKYKEALPPNYKKMLSVQLKKFVKSERLVKVKNSFKMSSTEKLKLTIKQTLTDKAIAVVDKKTKKEKVVKKTKRLSQVKTPEALKNAKTTAKKVAARSSDVKMKRLSQVKTPDRLKSKSSTPLKTKKGAK